MVFDGRFSAPKLLKWYEGRKYAYPWRQTRDPYRIWVSEVMLQQTQATRVAGFYENFIKKFPTLGHTARARWPQILGAVRGMGYYQRFRNMQKTAKLVLRDLEGRFPQDYAVLRRLPGIGDYTANALLAFAFGKDVPVIDTNVRRVLQHFYGKMNDEILRKKAMKLCPKGRARDFFQAIMDYAGMRGDRGAALHCEKNATPPPRTLQKLQIFKVAAAIIHQNGKILIQKRQHGRHLAGFWEFPGGKIEPGEDSRSCLKREIKEELGIEISVRPPFLKTRHAYANRTIELFFCRSQILLGRPSGCEGQKILWVEPSDFKRFCFAPADKAAVTRLTSK